MNKRKKHRERERHNKKEARRSYRVDNNQQRFEQTDLSPEEIIQEEIIQIESQSSKENLSSPLIETEEKILRKVSVTPVVHNERIRKKIIRKTGDRKQPAWKSVLPQSVRASWILILRLLFHLPRSISNGIRKLNRDMFIDPDIMRTSYIVPAKPTTPKELSLAQTTSSQVISSQTVETLSLQRNNALNRSLKGRVVSRWFPSFLTAAWIGVRRKIYHLKLASSKKVRASSEQSRSIIAFPSVTKNLEQKKVMTSAKEISSPQNRFARSHFKSTTIATTAAVTTITRQQIIRRKRRSPLIAWRLMGVAGIIGIILMLLLPFLGNRASSKRTLMISSNQPALELAELQFQLIRFEDMNERFESVSVSSYIAKKRLSLLPTDTNDLWDSFNSSRKEEPLLAAARFSTLEETPNAPVLQVENTQQQVDTSSTSYSSERTLKSVLIKKTIPKQVVAFQEFEYLLSVRNETNTPQYNIVIEEKVLAKHRITNVTPAAYYREETLRWNIQQLNAGESKEFKISILPLETGSLSTVSSWSASSNNSYVAFATTIDEPEEKRLPEKTLPQKTEPKKPRPQPLPLSKPLPEPSPKKESLSFPEPKRKALPIVKKESRLEMTLEMPSKVAQGKIVILQIHVSNKGNQDARNVIVSYRVPSQLVCKLGKKLDWEIETLPAGETKVGSIALRAEEVGLVKNLFALQSDTKRFDNLTRSLLVTKPPEAKTQPTPATTPAPASCECAPSFMGSQQ